jgi:hypothetical protein
MWDSAFSSIRLVVVSSMLSLVAFGALLLIPMSTAQNAIGDASVKQAR